MIIKIVASAAELQRMQRGTGALSYFLFPNYQPNFMPYAVAGSDIRRLGATQLELPHQVPA